MAVYLISSKGVYMTFETFEIRKDMQKRIDNYEIKVEILKDIQKRIINIENRFSNVDILPKRHNKKRKKLHSKMSLDELKKDGK